MRLISLNVGKPQGMEYKGKTVATGIFKQPAGGSVALSATNLDGDGQADLENHGGPDKAVCVYCAEHYPRWEERLGRKLAYGAFGENFTVTGLPENDVHIGDVFEIGTALVQVSQPRQPCYKLAFKHGVPELAAEVEQTGYTGYYFRVLREGAVVAGQPLYVVERDRARVSVAEANLLKYRAKSDAEGLRRLLAVEALSDSWRKSFMKMLAALEQ